MYISKVSSVTVTPVAGSPGTAQRKATATFVALPAQYYPNGFVVTAQPDNKGSICIGLPGTTNVADGTGNGEILQPGVPRSFATGDSSALGILLAFGNTSTTDFVTISGS